MQGAASYPHGRLVVADERRYSRGALRRYASYFRADKEGDGVNVGFGIP